MAVAERLFLEAITIFEYKIVDSEQELAKNYLYALSKSAYCFHISSFDSALLGSQGLVVLVKMGKRRIPEWTAGC